MQHVALYIRVSTSSQTVNNQRIRLIDYAERNGYTYDIYEEVESTRKTRPIKQGLLAKLRAGQYDAVVVYKLDRWARSSTELILEVQELIDKGIGFISLTDNLDFSTASGRLHFTILSAFAQFERDLTRDRTLSAMKRLKSDGYTFIGRKKGSKDIKKRKTDGYFAREERKRQMAQTKIALPPNN
jgi:DNA invertase Pin-like site-specific DNA recombinase